MKLSYEKTPEALLQDSVGTDTFLALIQQKVSELKKLNQLWMKIVTHEFAEHSRVANFREGCLVIEVDNAAWITYLRYHLPELKKRLSQESDLSTLQKIEWYIRPPSAGLSRQTTNNQSLVLSKNSLELLKNTAQQIKNKALQEALLRLIKP
ncbi:DUF721 domain-containing protein [Rickettsiella massiliensis]|uniref:DUF721 domain-containing protein n=1 Tax=Rickettsiella massiliensis TaxID=676517 RepID=UPI00029B51E8|nr:DUF721 domain-containing protein [Rickettsiella massiliensis]